MLVAIGLGSGVLLGTSALVVDVGRMHVEREQLVSGADAAAMATAQSTSCSSTSRSTRSAARNSTAT
jgi:uncharacterized membrane protein